MSEYECKHRDNKCVYKCYKKNIKDIYNNIKKYDEEENKYMSARIYTEKGINNSGIINVRINNNDCNIECEDENVDNSVILKIIEFGLYSFNNVIYKDLNKMIHYENTKNLRMSNFIEIYMLKLTTFLWSYNISPFFTSFYYSDTEVQTKYYPDNNIKYMFNNKIYVEKCNFKYNNIVVNDLLTYIQLANKYNDNKLPKTIKRIIFQVMYNLAIFNKLKIVHGDLNLNNILLQKKSPNDNIDYYIFDIDNKVYYVKNKDFNIKFWDYGYAFATYDSPFASELTNADIYFDIYRNCGYPNISNEDFSFCDHYDLFVFCFGLLKSNINDRIIEDFLKTVLSDIFSDRHKNYSGMLRFGRIIDYKKFKNKILKIEDIFKCDLFDSFTKKPSKLTNENSIMFKMNLNSNNNCMQYFLNNIKTVHTQKISDFL